jgi:hypothetical protein
MNEEIDYGRKPVRIVKTVSRKNKCKTIESD